VVSRRLSFWLVDSIGLKGDSARRTQKAARAKQPNKQKKKRTRMTNTRTTINKIKKQSTSNATQRIWKTGMVGHDFGFLRLALFFSASLSGAAAG